MSPPSPVPATAPRSRCRAISDWAKLTRMGSTRTTTAMSRRVQTQHWCSWAGSPQNRSPLPPRPPRRPILQKWRRKVRTCGTTPRPPGPRCPQRVRIQSPARRRRAAPWKWRRRCPVLSCRSRRKGKVGWLQMNAFIFVALCWEKARAS